MARGRGGGRGRGLEHQGLLIDLSYDDLDPI